MRYIFLATIFSVVFAYEKDMTIIVQPGKIDCFFHKVVTDEIIDIEYQVIDSTHGDLDISFQMSDPGGRMIVADYKKPENSHRHTATQDGDYRFCFDNSFSTFSKKTVFFDMLIEGEDPEERDYDDDKEMELGNAAETYMMRVRDISESVTRVKDKVSTARRLQELHSAHEARDRNLAEDMCSRVLKWSIGHVVLMLLVGITQVIFVKSLFEDTRNYRKLVPGFSS
ncbi:transmembrane emp24 domain-containing protein 5-like [Spodoptera litura]|uniref:Transmembrane emp24 domain-containing protein 5-like n=1 Tax=Spodoptera litura TaxID=69820 RepID=A0A9J7DZM8_SPOLT|nr:transmembrane emp24 domain-containing protein 5-like [Spodoptera litura]XP_022819185.1 transmembrane emp24 domain-containing protein 5-like [Spodoptera litura]XP_022819186.1 transmembrane emp24 domain-containing protein 5-like [Spodoptera litura]